MTLGEDLKMLVTIVPHAVYKLLHFILIKLIHLHLNLGWTCSSGKRNDPIRSPFDRPPIQPRGDIRLHSFSPVSQGQS